jgi:phage terminase large subunit-like protein
VSLDLSAVVSQLPAEAQAELAKLAAALEDSVRANRILQFYPDTGPLRRELYPKHLEFFRAGATYRERCFMAANRIGKSEGAGGYESSLHLTGEYPDWWEGRRFPMATQGYACGKTNETTRDIVQTKLFGKVRSEGQRKVFTGTGLVPARLIGDVTWKQGVADLADTVRVRHRTGQWSEVNLKSYAQGRGSFEGTERDWIWLDEEPPVDIYGECLIRTATTQGIVYITFTPLEGATEVVQSFMPAKMLNEIMESFRNARN